MTEKQPRQEAQSSVSAKPPPRSGFQRFGPALKHSFAGIQSTLRSESAFRQELCAFIILFPLAFWLGESSIERLLLIAPLFLVLIVELMNTAVEASVDRWGVEYHDLAKAAKDAGSAAVFISLVFVVVSWVILIFDKLIV